MYKRQQYGVLVPAIARPDPEGGYELVAGHRRHRASAVSYTHLAAGHCNKQAFRSLDDFDIMYSKVIVHRDGNQCAQAVVRICLLYTSFCKQFQKMGVAFPLVSDGIFMIEHGESGIIFTLRNCM